MIRIIAVALLALSLGSCATPLGRVLTTTIENPISGVDIYRVKNTYAAALELAVEYRRYCYSAPFAVLMTDPIARPVCERRRAVIRAMQSAQVRARAAIVAAQNFIDAYPTISAAAAISAAWQAVTDFQNAIPAKKE